MVLRASQVPGGIRRAGIRGARMSGNSCFSFFVAEVSFTDDEILCNPRVCKRMHTGAHKGLWTMHKVIVCLSK